MADSLRRTPILEPLERRDVPSISRAPVVDRIAPPPIASIEWHGQIVRAYADQWVVPASTPLDPSLHIRPFGKGFALVDLPAGTTPAAAQAILGAGIEPNLVVTTASIPNDPDFGNQYAFNNTGQTINGQVGVADADIDAPEAWNVTRGSSSVVVAVLDTGIDLMHPDLAANVFVNPGEIPGNGIDDDGDGYVDDVNGWDFVNNDNVPQDDFFHGTHVSGILAAVSDNGIGVAGVAPQIKVLPLKIFDSSGNGSLAGILAAFDYAQTLHDLGIRVVALNASWGFNAYVPQFEAAIVDSAARNMLVIAAAGNGNTNNDATPFYPASFPENNVIAVAASDNRDHKASNSQWGLTSVDIAAPGVDIESTLIGGYGISGTSMSVPQVAGTAALLWSLAPDATYGQVRDAIFAGGDPIADFATNGPTPISTGKRLNVFGAITQFQAAITPPAPTIMSVAPFVGPTSGGNAVVIAGTGFTFVTSVQFGGVNAMSFTVNSASQITAVAASGVGRVDVTVTNATGISATAGTGDDYTYALPSVTSMIVNGGDIVARNRFGVAPSLAGQKSVVEQLLVTFNQRVTLDPGAFGITNLSTSVSVLGAAPTAASVTVTATGVPSSGSAAAGYTQFVLTFDAGAGVNSFATNGGGGLGNTFTTLKNGLFQLNVTGANVHAGVSDTAADYSENFWSLYGAVASADVKVTGDVGGGDDTLLVDGLALNDVYATFGSRADSAGPPTYRPAYDWNLDGFVDGLDLNQLYLNFGTIWRF